METLKDIFSMKWMLMLATAISLSISLTACGEEDEDKDDGSTGNITASQLIGLWIDKDGDYTRFNADGTGFMYAEDETGYLGEEFLDYKVEKNLLLIKYEELDDGSANTDWYSEAHISSVDSKTLVLNYGDDWGVESFKRVSETAK